MMQRILLTPGLSCSEPGSVKRQFDGQLHEQGCLRFPKSSINSESAPRVFSNEDRASAEEIRFSAMRSVWHGASCIRGHRCSFLFRIDEYGKRQPMSPRSFFGELKRRNVIRAAILYVGGVWALAQGISQLGPSLGAPEWTTRWFLVAAGIGFPFWIAFAWFFEFTPEG